MKDLPEWLDDRNIGEDRDLDERIEETKQESNRQFKPGVFAAMVAATIILGTVMWRTSQTQPLAKYLPAQMFIPGCEAGELTGNFEYVGIVAPHYTEAEGEHPHRALAVVQSIDCGNGRIEDGFPIERRDGARGYISTSSISDPGSIPYGWRFDTLPDPIDEKRFEEAEKINLPRIPNGPIQ